MSDAYLGDAWGMPIQWNGLAAVAPYIIRSWGIDRVASADDVVVEVEQQP